MFFSLPSVVDSMLNKIFFLLSIDLICLSLHFCVCFSTTLRVIVSNSFLLLFWLFQITYSSQPFRTINLMIFCYFRCLFCGFNARYNVFWVYFWLTPKLKCHKMLVLCVVWSDYRAVVSVSIDPVMLAIYGWYVLIGTRVDYCHTDIPPNRSILGPIHDELFHKKSLSGCAK